MALYDVLKKIEFKQTGETKLPGSTVELDLARAQWLMDQGAVKPLGQPLLPPRSTQAAPRPSARRGCCGR
jgi:hypothetical protein